MHTLRWLHAVSIYRPSVEQLLTVAIDSLARLPAGEAILANLADLTLEEQLNYLVIELLEYEARAVATRYYSFSRQLAEELRQQAATAAARNLEMRLTRAVVNSLNDRWATITRAADHRTYRGPTANAPATDRRRALLVQQGFIRGLFHSTVIDNIGYIRFDTFFNNPHLHFREVIEAMLEAGVEGFIIDLRINRGGAVIPAEAILAHFLPAGSVVSFLSNSPCGSRASPNYSPNDNIFTNLPLTVLVGNGTMSMAEIFSAALQDHGRATIIGQTTAGKGYGTSHLIMRNRLYVIDISVGQYLRPSGHPIEHVGITPDIYQPHGSALATAGVLATQAMANDVAIQRAIEVIRQKGATR